MPYTTPRFRVQLTHPSSPSEGDGSRRATLHVEEIASSLNVFELELTSADLHNLIAGRASYPETKRLGPHPERWGHEMRHTSATYALLQSAEDAKRQLEAQGWVVDSLKRNSSHRWVVRGRRWDDAEA